MTQELPALHVTASSLAPDATIVARSVEKVYGSGGSIVRAVDGVSLSVPKGQFLCVMGPSGSGKSTLLHILGGLERPTGGTVLISNTAIHQLSDRESTRFRRRNIGFVFQFFNLIPTLDVSENIALPLLLEGQRYSAVRHRVDPLLRRFRLEERSAHSVSALSGGEMQRVAIARALIVEPRFVLADEPTGNLDSRTGEEILSLLRQVRDDNGVTVVLVTHDLRAASYADRVVILRDGRLDDDVPAHRLTRSE